MKKDTFYTRKNLDGKVTAVRVMGNSEGDIGVCMSNGTLFAIWIPNGLEIYHGQETPRKCLNTAKAIIASKEKEFYERILADRESADYAAWALSKYEQSATTVF
jgi:hypothetical protein